MLCGDDVFIVADAEQLKRVINNIVSNSVKYRDESRKEKITIAVYDEGDYVHILLADNGKALGQENCRVFLNVFTERIHQETAGRAEAVSDLPLLKKLLKTTREKSGQKVWRAKEQPCISIC